MTDKHIVCLKTSLDQTPRIVVAQKRKRDNHVDHMWVSPHKISYRTTKAIWLGRNTNATLRRGNQELQQHRSATILQHPTKENRDSQTKGSIFHLSTLTNGTTKNHCRGSRRTAPENRLVVLDAAQWDGVDKHSPIHKTIF